MKDIAIYGAGGFGREVACMIRLINDNLIKPKWNLIGFFDDNNDLIGTNNEYGKILGNIDILNKWESPLDIVIAIGSPNVLSSIINNIKNPNVDFPNIIMPSVIGLDYNNIRMGKGNIICSYCVIGCNVTIGNFNVINVHTGIGHDASLGNCNVIMPNCTICGGVKMGEQNFMGLKSAILQYVKVGNNTRIGAGAIVMKKTTDGFLYMGIPAKKIEL